MDTSQPLAESSTSESISSRLILRVPPLEPTRPIPHDSETPLHLRLLQYNILAQGLVNRKTQYPYLTKPHAKFKYRRANLLRDIRESNADIASFQEMDHYSDFWSRPLRELGYDAYHAIGFDACQKLRARAKYRGAEVLSAERRTLEWGVCIAWKRSDFTCVEKWTEAFCDVLPEMTSGSLESWELDQSKHFAMFCVLETTTTTTTIAKNTPATPTPTMTAEESEEEEGESESTVDDDAPFRLLVISTHLFWRPEFGYVRVRHLMRIREIVDEVRQRFPNIVPILMGDLNTSPNDPPYLLSVRPDLDLDQILAKSQMQFPESIMREWYPVRIAELMKENGSVDDDDDDHADGLSRLVAERDKRIRKKIVEFYFSSVDDDDVHDGPYDDSGQDRQRRRRLIDRIWFSAYGMYQKVRTDRSAPQREDYWDEPCWTTYMQDYRSTLDYVLFDYRQVVESGVVEVCALLEIPELDHPLPDGEVSSDHVCLVVDVNLWRTGE